MNTYQKTVKSIEKFAEILEEFDPYFAYEDSKSNIAHGVSYIGIIIYSKDAKEDRKKIKSVIEENELVIITEEVSDGFSYEMSVNDVFFTNQQVRIFVIEKDPNNRNKDLIKHWKEF